MPRRLCANEHRGADIFRFRDRMTGAAQTESLEMYSEALLKVS